MPRFIIDTTETVHGRYAVEADGPDHARTLFERGDIAKPDLYEATDVEINSVEVASEAATTKAPDRTPERQQFMEDIITTAVEGGTGHWAQVSHYQYLNDGEPCVYVRGLAGATEPRAFAVLHEMDDDEEDGYHEESLVLDADAVERGINRITSGEVSTGDHIKRAIVDACEDHDAGEIDADAADIIAQAALLGEVRYG